MVGLAALTQQELRQTQTEILQRFAELCQAHGLAYYLFAGTLLGAARHQGFIPWDDDIDVAMPRDDYARLGQALTAAGCSDLVLVTHESDERYPFPFAKLGLRGTLIRDITSGGLELPVNIDVFPLDPMVNGLLRRTTFVLVRVIERALGQPLAGWKRLPDALSRGLARAVGLNRLARLVAHVASRPRQGAEYVGAFTWGPGWLLRADSFMPFSRLPFEGRSYRVPRDWHDVLVRCYGDYMTPPAPEARVSHHTFEAFRLSND